MIRQRIETLFLALILAPMASMPLGAVSVSAQSETPDRQAESDVALLAEGEIPASIGNSVAWRVVQDVAEPQGQAQDETRSLGFGVPFAEPILTTVSETGRALEFGPGEAFYVADDSTTKRESLGDGAVPYYRIALVPAAEASDPGGDTLVVAGEPFELFGDSSSEVVRAVGGTVSDGAAIAFSTPYPAMLLVLEGSVSILPEETGGTISAGEAVLLPTGSPTGTTGFARADGGEARFIVAAVQRPEERPFSVGRTDSLSVTVHLTACPDGASVARVGANPGSAGPLCVEGDDPVSSTPLAETNVVLANVETGERFDGVTDQEGAIAFNDLPAGTYELSVPDGQSASRCQVVRVGGLDYV
ncbi:MAG: carboxypeptidase-like regulatory domain-containing protein, partial [Thermomicrobiales bacterium]